MEEISASCREQDLGANEVNKAIHRLDQVIQRNAGTAEEMSATSEALSGQAQRLQASIAFFRIGEREQSAAPEERSAGLQTARPKTAASSARRRPNANAHQAA